MKKVIFVFIFFIVTISIFEFTDYNNYKSFIIKTERLNEIEFLEKYASESLVGIGNRRLYSLESMKNLGKNKEFFLINSLDLKDGRVVYHNKKIYSQKGNIAFVREIEEEFVKLRLSLILKALEASTFVFLFALLILLNHRKGKYKTIAKQNEILNVELRKASEIQRKIFNEIHIKEKKYEIHSFYKPYIDVGGDFYSVDKIKKNKYLVYIGDFSGSGITSALMSFYVKILVENFRENIEDLEMTFNKLNKIFSGLDGLEEYYITMLMGVVDLDKMEMEYISAGHPIPLSKDENNNVSHLFGNEKGDFVIGMLSSMEFKKKKLKLDKKEYLFYTDGVLEELGYDKLITSFIDSDEEKFRNKLSLIKAKDDMSYIYLKIKK